MENNTSMTLHEYATFFLKTRWNEFLKDLTLAIGGVDREIMLDEKYLATAEKKGKTEQQIRARKVKYEQDLAHLRRYEIELGHYSKVNEDIISGKIQPHFKEVCANGLICSVNAYYIVPMPEGNLGYFDPACLGGIVRKLR